MTLPLADLRVVDLSTVIAGPNCARYLADFGADVVKVERPGTGDSLRNMAWRDPRDGDGIRRTLTQIVDDFRGGRLAVQPDEATIDQFDREKQAAKLAALLAQATART